VCGVLLEFPGGVEMAPIRHSRWGGACSLS
jgi:hypothetical protein